MACLADRRGSSGRIRRSAGALHGSGMVSGARHGCGVVSLPAQHQGLTLTYPPLPARLCQDGVVLLLSAQFQGLAQPSPLRLRRLQDPAARTLPRDVRAGTAAWNTGAVQPRKGAGSDGGGGGMWIAWAKYVSPPCTGGGALSCSDCWVLPCLSARAGAPSCTAGLLGLPHLPPGSLLYSRALLSCSSFPQPCMSPSSAVTIHVPYTMNRCPPHLPEWFPLCRLQDPSAPTYYLGYPSPQQPATYGPDSNSRQVQHGWGGGTGGTAGRAGQLDPLAFPYSQAYPAAMTRNQPGRIP